MIAGRFRWLEPGSRKKVPARISLARFEFPTGALVLTEAGTKRRAALHVVAGRSGLHRFDLGGLGWRGRTTYRFARPFRRRTHPLQRSLADTRLVSGSA